MTVKVLRMPALALIGAVALASTPGAMAQQLESADCAELSGGQAASCRQALAGSAGPNVFLRLGEQLLETRNFPLAVKVYRRGLQVHPGNTELQAQLTVAESGLREFKWIEERKDDTSRQAEAAAKADIFKCTRLATSAPQTALQACEAALAVMPQDPRLLEAKGDSLRVMGSNAEAYLAYAAAARQESSAALTEKLTALAKYKPKPPPEPEPVKKKEPEPEPVQTAKATPAQENEPSASAEPEPSEAEKQAAERAALLRTINDPEKRLAERLKARNVLMNMAHRQDDG